MRSRPCGKHRKTLFQRTNKKRTIQERMVQIIRTWYLYSVKNGWENSGSLIWIQGLSKKGWRCRHIFGVCITKSQVGRYDSLCAVYKTKQNIPKGRFGVWVRETVVAVRSWSLCYCKCLNRMWNKFNEVIVWVSLIPTNSTSIRLSNPPGKTLH